MTKLVCAGLAIALSLAACVTDDDVATPPTDDQSDDSQADDDRVPIDPSDKLPTPCASFDGKGDSPCVP